MASYFKRVTAYSPTRLWINNVTPAEAEQAIAAGAVGCTQNPTYPYKMLTHPTNAGHALALLDAILESEKDDNAAQAVFQLALVKEVADAFLPVYQTSKGRAGYVTIQADPFREDVETILAAARAHCDAAPNIMAKVPAIPAGYEAMKNLLREGRPLLATEVMSVAQARDCAALYQAACDEMQTPPVMYFAHIPGIFDTYIADVVQREGIDIPSDFVWQGGVAIAKKIAELLRDGAYDIGFCSGGARDLHHFTEMVGADCCVTINWSGTADALLAQNPPVIHHFARATPAAVLDALCSQIPDFRRGWQSDGLLAAEYQEFGPVVLFRTNFEEAWNKGLQFIARRRAEIGA